MSDPSRRRLARVTALAHRKIMTATRSMIRAHQRRIELFDGLAKAYLAEADAQDDERVAANLRTHARFAEKFGSLTNDEISNLQVEAERAEAHARLAEARSRGEAKDVRSPAAPGARGSRPRKSRKP